MTKSVARARIYRQRRRLPIDHRVARPLVHHLPAQPPGPLHQFFGQALGTLLDEEIQTPEAPRFPQLDVHWQTRLWHSAVDGR